MRRPSKYGNRKVVVDGQTFDSVREHKRWCVLKLMERAGEISALARQVPFPLQVNGVSVGKYIADATYIDKAGVLVVEDAKGFRTDTYKLKRRLMKAIHNIDILET